MNPESTIPGEAVEMDPRGTSASPPCGTPLNPHRGVPACSGEESQQLLRELPTWDKGMEHKDGDREGME